MEPLGEIWPGAAGYTVFDLSILFSLLVVFWLSLLLCSLSLYRLSLQSFVNPVSNDDPSFLHPLGMGYLGAAAAAISTSSSGSHLAVVDR